MEFSIGLKQNCNGTILNVINSDSFTMPHCRVINTLPLLLGDIPVHTLEYCGVKS